MIGNEPAFLIPNERLLNDEKGTRGDHYSGMTIRQYFVAQAMKGILAANEPTGAGDKALDVLSKEAVIVADACLAAETETRK